MTIERTLAGHRVLRLLAPGDRSQVWLGAEDVVLKALTSPVPVGAPGREAEALHRARGEHVVELLDVSQGADGTVLVFPRLPRGSLAELLTRRATLDAGEAVTILAPIATCLARLHAAGVAHAGLSPGSVLFTSDGAPTLIGFAGAELFEPGLPEVALERIEGVVSDRAALRGLAETVLARTTGARGKVASRLRERLLALPHGPVSEWLTGELFDLAAARPVRFEADAAETESGIGRLVAVADAVAPEEGEPPAVGVRSWALGVLESGPGSIVRGAVRERWSGWSVPRRRAMLGAGAAGLALVVALVVVPAPGARDLTVPQPIPAAGHSDSSGEQSAAEAAITGDDPLAALAELVVRRARCFRDLSVLCLDGADEPGSSASDIDRDAIRAVLDGADAPRTLHVASATIVERLGDSALVDLGPDSDPASILLLKGEAGWRIRDYLAD